MNDAEYNHLREESWRRVLTAAEEGRLQAHLAAHPDAPADWEAEKSLTQFLADLPDVPVSSNFTSLVLQAVDREAGASVQRQSVLDGLKSFLRRPVSRLAWVAAVFTIAFVGLQQYRAWQRFQMVESVAHIPSVAALPDPRLFQDFDAIQRLNQLATVDDAELIRVLSPTEPARAP
jgi:hypothetical protein